MPNKAWEGVKWEGPLLLVPRAKEEAAGVARERLLLLAAPHGLRLLCLQASSISLVWQPISLPSPSAPPLNEEVAPPSLGAAFSKCLPHL